MDYKKRFAMVMLSRSNKVLGLNWISQGGITGTIVDVRLIFQAALKANASSIILVHNHPNGQLEASEADLRVTRKIRSGGEILDIAVLDHLIITSEKYISLADEGHLS